MPYKLRKAPGRDLYWVVNKETKEKYSKEPITKAKAEAQMRALYSNMKGEIRGGRRISDEDLMKVKEYRRLAYHDPFPDHEDVHRWWHLHPNLKSQDFRHSSLKREDKYPTAMVRLHYLPQTKLYWVGSDWENYVKRGRQLSEYSGYLSDKDTIEDVPLDEYARLLDAGKIGNPNRRWHEVVMPNEYTKLGVKGWYVPPGQVAPKAPAPYVPLVIPKAPPSSVEDLVRRQMEATREAQAKPRNGRGRKKGGATLIQRGKASRLRERFQLDGRLFPLYQWLSSVVHSNNDRDFHTYDGQNPFNAILDGTDINNENALRRIAMMLGQEAREKHNWNGAPIGNQIIPALPAGVAPMPPPAPPKPAPVAPWARKKAEPEFEIVGDIVPPGTVDEGDEEEEEEEEEKAPTPPVAPPPPPPSETVAPPPKANEPPRPPPPPPSKAEVEIETEDAILEKAMERAEKEKMDAFITQWYELRNKLRPAKDELEDTHKKLVKAQVEAVGKSFTSFDELKTIIEGELGGIQAEYEKVKKGYEDKGAKIKAELQNGTITRGSPEYEQSMKVYNMFGARVKALNERMTERKKAFIEVGNVVGKLGRKKDMLIDKTNAILLQMYNLMMSIDGGMLVEALYSKQDEGDIIDGGEAILADEYIRNNDTSSSAILEMAFRAGGALRYAETIWEKWVEAYNKGLAGKGKGRKGGAIPPVKELHYMAKQAYEQHPDSNIGQNRLIKHTPTLKFYQNGNNIIVAIRGTADTNDWVNNNARIPISDLRSGDRYQNDSKVIREMKNKYPGYEFYGVAHSLGGALLDEFIDDGLISRGISYNPAVQTKDFNKPSKNERIYNEADPLYNTMGVMLTDKPQVRRNKAKKGWVDYLISKIPGVGKVLDYGKTALDAHNLDSLEGGSTREERGWASYYREKYYNAIPEGVFDALTDILKDPSFTPNNNTEALEWMDDMARLPRDVFPTSTKWTGGANIAERGLAGEMRAKMAQHHIVFHPDALQIFNEIIHSKDGYQSRPATQARLHRWAEIIDSQIPFIGSRDRSRPSTGVPIEPSTDADASPDLTGTRKGTGKNGVAGSPTRADPLSRDEYLSRARAKAKSEGYPYKLLGYADDGKHKLQIPNKDGKIIRFGRQGYGDFIIWSAKEASGKVPEGYAKQKRNTFHNSHSKIKGRWRSDLFSPNMLALKILW